MNGSSSVMGSVSEFLRSSIVDDWEVKDWLARTSDGKMFLIARSLRKQDPKMPREELESVLDAMTEEQINDVSSNCFMSVFKGDALYQSILFPEKSAAADPSE